MLKLLFYTEKNTLIHIESITSSTIVPRVGEYILYKSTQYLVTTVVHCYNSKTIRVITK